MHAFVFIQILTIPLYSRIVTLHTCLKAYVVLPHSHFSNDFYPDAERVIWMRMVVALNWPILPLPRTILKYMPGSGSMCHNVAAYRFLWISLKYRSAVNLSNHLICYHHSNTKLFIVNKRMINK